MKLIVKNLNVIKSGVIELNGITVLAGKNGTGKSTIGKSLYCLGRAFYHADEKVHDEIERQLFMIFRNSAAHVIGKSRRVISQASLTRMIESFDSTGDVLLPKEYLDAKPTVIEQKEIEEKVRIVLSIDPLQVLTGLLARTLQTELGENVNPVNNPRRTTHIDLKLMDNELLSVSINKGKQPIIQTKRAIEKDIIYIDDPYVLDTLSTMAGFQQVLSRFSHRADLEERLLKVQDDNSVINDILAEQNWKEIIELIDELSEGDVVRGKSEDFLYQSPAFKEPLSIRSLSMGLKSILLLKTLLKNGSLNNTGLLIFDEPEIHLHPEMQFGLAKILVLIPKILGIKIILSTHSTDFLSAINYYSNENGLTEVTKYYQLKKEGDYSIVRDVTGDIDVLYEELSSPFLQVVEKL